MSKTLARLTAEHERDTKAVIDKLEELSSYASEDVRFIADQHQQTSRLIASLGLDPRDTTAEELFHGLQAKLLHDAKQFARAINYGAGEPRANAKKLVELASAARPLPEAYALKKSVAKSLLRSEPPLHLMKKLKYRSVESMLKREDISQLFAVLMVTESHSWHKKLLSRLSRVKASDFEIRNLEYRVIQPSKWLELSSASHPVSYAPLMGAVTVWPVETLNRPESVCFGIQVLQAAEIVEVDSLYLKNFQFQPEFGQLASQLFESGEQQALQIGGKAFFDWHNLKSLFSMEHSPIADFTSLHPVFNFWKGAEHALLIGEEVVSTHIADVLSGIFEDSNYETRSVGNGTAAVKTSVLEKYLAHPNVARFFRAQLDDTTLVLEPAVAEDSIRADMEIA